MKLIIDTPDMIYNILNGDSSWKGLSIDYILNAVKDGTPLEAQPTEECEDNGSPWCLGHCPYRNTSQRPYEDTIYREKVLKIIDNLSDLSYRWDVARYIINNLPSATPQKPKGKWIEHEIKDTYRWLTCSVCGYEWINKKENFCPNCGAEMSEDCGKQNL